jgi:hypothetical protein
MGSNQTTEQPSQTAVETTGWMDEPEDVGNGITKVTLHPPGVPNKLAYGLYNVFTPEECQEWINMTEERGYEPALVNVGGGQQQLMSDVRNNMRCIIDSTELANKLYERIAHLLPDSCEYR